MDDSIPGGCHPLIKGAIFIPIGRVTQLTLDENNKIKIKYSVTHDTTFPQLSGVSAN